MGNMNKIQKKKTVLRTILNILYKILIAIAITIFAYIIYDKADFSTNSMDFKSMKKKDTSQKNLPSDLKWFDDFKGVENVPKKKTEKQKASNGNTGFRYEGFKK